jgi:flagellar biosynthetic protein FliR
VLSVNTVSVSIRLSMAFVIGLSAFVAAGMPPVGTTVLSEILVLVMVEVLTGGATALAARMMLESLSSAGHLAGMGTGMGHSSIMDPMTGTESTAPAQLFTTVGLCFAVALGVHRDAVALLLWSVHTGGLAPVIDVNGALQHLITAAVSSVVIGVKLGFPILCAGTFGHIALGLLGRASQQLSLQSIGFAIAVISGGYALYLVLPDAGAAAAHLSRAALAVR